MADEPRHAALNVAVTRGFRGFVAARGPDWVRVSVADTSGERRSLEVSVDDGEAVVIELAALGEKDAWFVAGAPATSGPSLAAGRALPAVSVRVRDRVGAPAVPGSGSTSAEASASVVDRLCLVVAETETPSLAALPPSCTPVVIAPAELPEAWQVLDGLEAIVTAAAETRLSDAQRRALARYQRRGGELSVSPVLANNAARPVSRISWPATPRPVSVAASLGRAPQVVFASGLVVLTSGVLLARSRSRRFSRQRRRTPARSSEQARLERTAQAWRWRHWAFAAGALVAPVIGALAVPATWVGNVTAHARVSRLGDPASSAEHLLRATLELRGPLRAGELDLGLTDAWITEIADGRVRVGPGNARSTFRPLRAKATIGNGRWRVEAFVPAGVMLPDWEIAGDD